MITYFALIYHLPTYIGGGKANVCNNQIPSTVALMSSQDRRKGLC